MVKNYFFYFFIKIKKFNSFYFFQKAKFSSMNSTNASTNYLKSEISIKIEKSKSSEGVIIDKSKDEGHFKYEIGQIIQNYKVLFNF